MPLRDHFRPPLDDFASWEGLYGQWPAVIVQRLRRRLPEGFAAEPRVGHGAESSADDEYEVRIYDVRRGRTLVAAIEIVSPANKDRPGHRNLFVAKCAALLQKGVAVGVVDLVTVKRFNLYAELLALIGHADPTLGEPPPHLYAASCRWVGREKKSILEAWSYPLALGEPLPTPPLWLGDDLAIPLDLEASYEQACADLGLV